MQQQERIVFRRKPAVQVDFDIGRVTVDNRIKDGLLPPSIPLGPRLRGWPAHELETIKRAMTSGASNEQIRELVRKLVARRALALEGT